jgi:protease-4
MAQEKTVHPGESTSVDASTVIVRVETAPATGFSRWIWRTVLWALLISILFNLWFILDPLGYSQPAIPEQRFSGDHGAADRIAIINFEGTISPPFTERWMRQIKRAAADESVRGVVMAIDSPGGFVADSHQLYREIQKLAKLKPVYVAMKRLAASGGYYIAMGIGEQGRIFAEPTTWTGSIGVIIPRYNATELVEKIGLKAVPRHDRKGIGDLVGDHEGLIRSLHFCDRSGPPTTGRRRGASSRHRANLYRDSGFGESHGRSTRLR